MSLTTLHAYQNQLRGSTSGQGIEKAMGEYSLKDAKRIGYKAIQFDIVIKDNDRAIKFWQKLGFDILGEYLKPLITRKRG